MESFAIGRKLCLGSFHMKASFAEAKPPILRARKREGSTWETSEAGRLPWKALR